MDSKETARENLISFKKILDDLNIPFFIDGGTLLGAYRDGDFCLGDENDIDLASFSAYQDKIPEIIKAAESQGFTLLRYWQGDARTPMRAQEIAMYREEMLIPELGKIKFMKIDLYFYEEAKNGVDAWTCVYNGEDKCIPRVVPLENIKNLKDIDFLGIPLKMPDMVEQYLAHTYGDWERPVHRRDYSCYNPDQLRALQPDFKFYDE